MRARARGFKAVLDRLEEGFIAAALAFMTLLTFVQVVLRHFFDTGFVWSLEATTYTFAWLVLIGMSYGVRTQAHIAIDLLTARLPARAARAAALTALTLCIGYCLFMLFASVVFVERLLQLGHDARDIAAPRWLLTAVLPIGFALLALRFLEAGWRALLAQRRGLPGEMPGKRSGERSGGPRP